MSSAATPRLATYSDLLALPEDVRAEVLGGEIVTEPSPLPKHSKAQRSLGGFIGRPFDDDHGHGGPGGWWIFIEVDVQLGPHDVVRPDLSGWRRERLPNPADTRPIDLAPDWVCEVLSPSTAARDRKAKSELYAQSQVPYYWLVDVESRILEARTLHDGQWLVAGTYAEDDVARIAPFEEVELQVGRLFMPKTPEP